jgi:lactate permease
MLTAAYLAPLLLVILLLAGGRVGTVGAGFAGLVAAAAAAVVSPVAQLAGRGIGALGQRGAPQGAQELLVAAWLAKEALFGVWLAWLVIAVIVGGLFFWRCLEALRGTQPAARSTEAAAPTSSDLVNRHRRLWFACFLLGPFAESVTGFGVGCIVALAYILGLGLRGLPALLLGLYSQILVPWGALAIGTTLGAALAAVPLADLGYGSAVLQAPMLALYLVLFWRLAAWAGGTPSMAQRLDDVLWTILLALTLIAANLLVEIEIAGAAAAGVLLLARWLSDERPDLAGLRATAVRVWPYLLLVGLLLATRLVPPLRELLRGAFALQPVPGLPSYAPLYNPGTLLVVSGIVALLATPAPLRAAGRALGATVVSGWRPVLVTLLFVVMARLYGGSGMAAALADAMHGAAGNLALLGSPAFAAIAGFLTASSAAGNAMVMPLQSALALQSGIDGFWLIALQNTVAANLTLLSPARVAMGVALMGATARESEVYRQGWWLALPALLVGLATAVLLLVL